MSVCLYLQPSDKKCADLVLSTQAQGGPKELMEVANQLAIQLAAGMATRHHSLTRSDKLVPAQEAAPLLELARMQVKKTQPNLVHPLMCVDAVEEGVLNGAAAGLAKVRAS